MSTYNPERIDHVALLIRHLLKSSKVHTVFVTWHNPKLDVPQELADIDPERVRILRQVYDSLNNRFNPVNEIVTEAVYIVDDDIFIDIDDLEFTFQVSHFSLIALQLKPIGTENFLKIRLGEPTRIASWATFHASTSIIQKQEILNIR